MDTESDHLYGTETEYAIKHYPERPPSGKKVRLVSEATLFSHLTQALGRKSPKKVPKRSRNGGFLTNGARFYLDIGHHPEYATPECLTLRDVILAEEAGERLLERLQLLATNRMHADGYPGEIFICKNNRDIRCVTYGSHESFLIRVREGRKSIADFAKKYAGILMPLLITRQLFCGAGTILPRPKEKRCYQVSQRADFIDEEAVKGTVHSKPIINLREEPLADDERYLRLHLIVGDANMSRVSKVLKIGMMSIVLDLLERGVEVFHVPETRRPTYLEAPVQAIKDLSVNPWTKLPLKDGSSATGLQIQEAYLVKAEEYASGFSAEVQEIIRLWRRVHNAFKKGDPWLDRVIDWKIKERQLCHYLGDLYPNEIGSERQDSLNSLLEKLAKRKGSIPADVYVRLAKRDLCYHDIRRDKGIFYLLRRGGFIDDVVFSDITGDEVEETILNPPGITRARARAAFLTRMTTDGIEVVDNWYEATVPRKSGGGKPLEIVRWPSPFDPSLNVDLDDLVRRYHAS